MCALINKNDVRYYLMLKVVKDFECVSNELEKKESSKPKCIMLSFTE